MIGDAPAESFSGAKLALICGEHLLVYRRDARPDLPFSGQWDLPGGGREGAESPVACALRELDEEFGLTVDGGRICWSRVYPSWSPAHAPSYFMAAQITVEEIADVRFGDEGQCWQLMPITEFLAAADAVSHLRDRLRDYLADTRAGA